MVILGYTSLHRLHRNGPTRMAEQIEATIKALKLKIRQLRCLVRQMEKQLLKLESYIKDGESDGR